jgi:hypothetical protein
MPEEVVTHPARISPVTRICNAKINSLIFFLRWPQMSFRIGLLLGLLVALSVILWFMPNEGFQTLNTSAAAPIIEEPPRIYPARVVAPSGPSAPNQAPPEDEISVATPEVARDPYEQPQDSASIPERMRYPERMFNPAPHNDNVDVAPASGIASASANQAAHALQAFTPEFAQNGGEFMQGIFANDSSEPGAYSAF